MRRAADELSELRIRGFTTAEIRKAGQRVGFRIETFDGQGAVLAHVETRSAHRVGRYGVDIETLDRVASDRLSGSRGDVFFIDEIGKMETFSASFVQSVEGLLGSPAILVATVGLRGGGFIASVKRRPDVLLWTVSRENRDRVPAEIAAWVRRNRS
jgi:nucleoside-triphosphatase